MSIEPRPIRLVQTRRKFLLLATSVAGFPFGSRTAQAQSYPTRSITIVIPYPPGGPTDLIGRALADHLRTSLGQPIIFENVGGGSGSIGTERVARAAPDGHTICIGNTTTHVFNGATHTLNYQVLNDFEPISMLLTIPHAIVAKRAVPAQDLTEFIAWLRANPNKVLAGTAGPGSTLHVAGVLFQKITNTQFDFVHYRATHLAMQDLIAGHIDMMFDAGTFLPHLSSNRIRVYALAAKNRLAAAPQIPTVDESGLLGFYSSVWFAMWAPKSTPKSIIMKLNSAVKEALVKPVVRARLADLGGEVPADEQQTPAGLDAFQRSEIDKWWPIIKAAGIKQTVP